MIKTIAITGATGGIGGHLVAVLRENGFRVYALSRENSYKSPDWLHFDLNQIESLKLPDRIDFFLHAAHDFSARTWEEMERSNIESALRLFEKVKKSGCENFVYFSSIAAFEGATSNYGKAKKKVEDTLLPKGAICVRPGLVYGVRSGLVATLQRQIINNKLIPLIDGGKQNIYPISVQNLCVGILKIIEDSSRFKVKPVVLAAKKPITLHAFALTLARQSHKTPCFFPIPGLLVYLSLRLTEVFRINIAFRSDSVVGLRNQCLDPFEKNLSLDVEPEGVFHGT